MAAVFGAAYAKIKTIIVVDLVDNRLELAKTLGATHSINGKTGMMRPHLGSDKPRLTSVYSDSDVLKQIREITDGGCDYVVEATGAAPCIKTGWEVSESALKQRGKSLIPLLNHSTGSWSLRQDGAIR